MMKKIFAAALALTLSASMALAASTDHSQMNHGTMNHETMNHDKNSGDTMEQKHSMAMGEGVIHSISKLNRMVNITHSPIPELNWPEMTMDLAVAKDVDLSVIKVGDKVKFHLMLDDDNVFRIHHIEK
ncbi:copper-binding protein [Desulforhopalus sp. IMCC35007]|uniref:copper-binding protein n=1 Tax=Desulforhopalus sp. IMCC35007 TaxID=2569543 RepID=UPI00145E6057|nr:copper-binding protein [Desulforhopalus sp. IMCC35007]